MFPWSAAASKKCNKFRNQCLFILTLSVPETKAVEFANSIDLDEVARNQTPSRSTLPAL